jgi:hypothetical protein
MLHLPAYLLQRKKVPAKGANMDIPLDDDEGTDKAGVDGEGALAQNDKMDYQVVEEPESNQPGQGNLKTDFYEHVLGKITNAMLEEMSVSKPSVSAISDFINQSFCYKVCRINAQVFQNDYFSIFCQRHSLRGTGQNRGGDLQLGSKFALKGPEHVFELQG